MGFIKIEETRDTLWVKIGLKQGKRNVIFMARSKKPFELAAKEICKYEKPEPSWEFSVS